MNKDILKGKWNQYKGEAKKKWGELTDDELDQINGEKDIIVGKIQEKYGKSKEEAEKEFDDWSNGLDRDNRLDRNNELDRNDGLDINDGLGI